MGATADDLDEEVEVEIEEEEEQVAAFWCMVYEVSTAPAAARSIYGDLFVRVLAFVPPARRHLRGEDKEKERTQFVNLIPPRKAPRNIYSIILLLFPSFSV